MKAVFAFSLLFSGAMIWMGAGSVAQAKDLDYLDFEGSYKLVRSLQGQCETILTVVRQDDDENFLNVFAGSYLFRNINGGTWTQDDYFAKRVITAKISGNVLSQTEKIWDKSLRRSEVASFGIRKSGRSLSLWSRTSLFPNLQTRCLYKMESDEPLKLPWDPGLQE